MPLPEGSRIAILQVRCVVGELCVSHVSIGFLTFPGSLNRARHATGGSIPGLLPRLSDQQLNVSQSINNTGIVRRFPRVRCFGGNPPFD